MIGDITVLGMTMGQHILEDIGVSVPQGMLVTIPADVAMLSKDLWLAISQKQIFRIHAGTTAFVMPSKEAEPVRALVDQNQQLQQALTDQHARGSVAMDQLRIQGEQLKLQGEQLKLQGELLKALLQNGAPRWTPGAPAQGPAPSSQATVQMPSEDAPTFIPMTIKPDDVVVRIEAKIEEAEGSDIANNRSKLRKLRQ